MYITREKERNGMMIFDLYARPFVIVVPSILYKLVPRMYIYYLYIVNARKNGKQKSQRTEQFGFSVRDPQMYIVVVAVVLLLPIVIIVRVSVAGALDDDFALTAFPSETYYIRTYI